MRPRDRKPTWTPTLRNTGSLCRLKGGDCPASGAAAIQTEIEQAQSELDAIKQGTWLRRAMTCNQPDTPCPASLTLAPRMGSAPRTLSTPSTDGYPIFVGRNARENDALTFGLARSEDLWLHARNVPGSHVVVRLEKGTEPPIETHATPATWPALQRSQEKRERAMLSIPGANGSRRPRTRLLAP